MTFLSHTLDIVTHIMTGFVTIVDVLKVLI